MARGVKRAAGSDERKSQHPSHPLLETLDGLVDIEDADCLLAALQEVPEADWLKCGGGDREEFDNPHFHWIDLGLTGSCKVTIPDCLREVESTVLKVVSQLFAAAGGKRIGRVFFNRYRSEANCVSLTAGTDHQVDVAGSHSSC